MVRPVPVGLALCVAGTCRASPARAAAGMRSRVADRIRCPPYNLIGEIDDNQVYLPCEYTLCDDAAWWEHAWPDSLAFTSVGSDYDDDMNNREVPTIAAIVLLPGPRLTHHIQKILTLKNTFEVEAAQSPRPPADRGGLIPQGWLTTRCRRQRARSCG